MSEFTPNRRTVIRTAAWSAPVVAVAAAAPAFATSPGAPNVATYTNVTKAFQYSALAGAFTVNVEVTATNVPVNAPVGATLLPIETRSVVTLPADLAGALQSLLLGNAAQVSGTSVSVSQLTGALELDSATDLTIPMVPIPTGADLITIASGTGNALVVPDAASPGRVTITMGQPNSVLVGHNADGTPNGRTYNSVLEYIDGNDYVLHEFQIVPEFVPAG